VSLSILLAIYCTVLGLILGSYLNVVIYRLPRDLSTVLPRSRCPACGGLIAARDNIPLLSYLLLRGRCRHCAVRISPLYPTVEALTGALFLLSYLRFGLTPDAAAAALFVCLMLVLAVIDAEHLLLPDLITLPGIVVGLAISHWVSWTDLLSSALGAALGAGFLYALWWIWYWVRKEEGLGLGDVKMLAMVGAFLGWKGVLITLFFGSVAGSVVGLGVLALGRGDLKSKLPFGTFLALGGLIALFMGPALARSYLSLF